MSQEENPSKFNGLILEIRGKVLIQHTYSDHNNQHHIAVAIPQLDQAERQVKCCQYDNTGNLISEVDLTGYNSIEIVEVSQQTNNKRQSSDSINMEDALSRNQPRLSDFYKSYQLEDSGIDWSKIDTKVTLPNTSGKFYNHDNKRTVGFKIELSPETTERIDIRNGIGTTIANFFPSNLFSTTLHIDNLCQLEDTGRPLGEEPGTISHFCAPYVIVGTRTWGYNNFTLDTTINPNVIWSLCQKCGVLYNSSSSAASVCFDGNGHAAATNKSTPSVPSVSYLFSLPFYNGLAIPSWENGVGCVNICTLCGMACSVKTNPNGTIIEEYSCPSPTNYLHSTPVLSSSSMFYWANTEISSIEDNKAITTTTWKQCTVCAGLYYTGNELIPSSSIGNKCSGGGLHTPDKPSYLLSLITTR